MKAFRSALVIVKFSIIEDFCDITSTTGGGVASVSEIPDQSLSSSLSFSVISPSLLSSLLSSFEVRLAARSESKGAYAASKLALRMALKMSVFFVGTVRTGLGASSSSERRILLPGR